MLHDIGRHIGGQWAVSKIVLAMWLDGNQEALAAYLRGDRASPMIGSYFARFGLLDYARSDSKSAAPDLMVAMR